jgi:hypothetical protein
MESKEELLKELGWNSDLIRCFIGREISIIPNVAKNKLENIQDSSTT